RTGAYSSRFPCTAWATSLAAVLIACSTTASPDSRSNTAMTKHFRQWFSGHSRAAGICGLSMIMLIGSSAALAQRQTLDKIIAVVDDGVILQSEYDERYAEIMQRVQTMDLALPPPD